MDFVISIPNDKLAFVKQLLSELNLPLKPIEAASLTIAQQRLADDLTESLREVELHQQGKIKLQTAEELLKELEDEEKLERE
ncbi:MAG TPA: hypothetical protein VFO93_09355 [Hymenobacter sp.]|uniref:hypothetical protein n=1 Tax=Hymenobacter sp. TaxID=1898978 RepID=UPI002D7E9096|nr:hypothetical protein [Hymenobacter sp.]HET9503737.1 hypothetical protein [Hymenobacter sp.]